jgi:outer membrane protein assembly factor BamB
MRAAGASRRRFLLMIWVSLALLIAVAACGDGDTDHAQSAGTIGVTETPLSTTLSATQVATPVSAASPTTVPVSTPTTDASPTSPASATAMPTDVPAAPAPDTITALDFTTGSERWQQQTRLLSRPLLGGDALYFIEETTSDGIQSLIALDLATGTERWRIPAPYGSQLNVADETTAYLEYDAAVHAIDAVTGKERWVVDGFAAQAADDGIVVGWPWPENGLLALDAATGQERWSLTEGTIQRPIIAGGIVYGGLPANERGGEGVYALDAVTGATRWTFEMPGGYAVAVAAGNVILTRELSAELIAVDAVTGQERWRYTTNGGYGIEHITASEGGVYVIVGGATSGAPLVALDPQTGTVRWEATGYRSPLGAITGLLVVMSS